MAVIEVDVTSREEYAGGQAFGSAGPYDRIDGVLTFAVDPEDPANAPVADLDLAPRDDQGRVRFRSDFALLTPREAGSGGKLLVDVVNRGRRGAVNSFNRVPPSPAATREQPLGDGFLFRHGFSVVSIGWQWDVYRSEALLGLQAPRVEVDGQPVRGQTVVEIRPSAPQRTWLLAHRQHQPYPVADPNASDATLLVRDWEDGPDTEVPRTEWSFARESDGGVVPNREHIYCQSGFQPGKIYHVVYTAEGTVVVGTGLLAIRDVAAWLRHPSPLNPMEGGFETVYGYGASQTGRILRHFLYLGLNVDEEGRRVYDGLLPHVAGGRRGQFNHRFAQPSNHADPSFGHLFPFADEDTVDLLAEHKNGLLSRQRELGSMPKVVYTNSSAEYWRGDASLAHTDAEGTADLEVPSETRSYMFAGTQHGPGSVPQSRSATGDGDWGRYPLNVVDYRPLLRAALINLDRWAAEGVGPPPSRHPRLGDGTAVTRAEVFDSLPVIPGIVTLDPERLWVVREVDLGPEAEAGVGRYPVEEGRTYPCYVSPLDPDGNETAGVRLPDLEAPVGTHAGWNPRDPETGAPEQIVPMQGFTLFFAPTKAAREATGDSRPSIEERYTGREEYLARVSEIAERLAEERYILPEDVEIVVEACATRHDIAVSRSPEEVGALSTPVAKPV